MEFFIFHQINSLALRWLWLDTLAIFFAEYFGYLLILFLFLLLFKSFKKYWPVVLQSFASAFLARLVIINIIRQFLPRARPFVKNQINLLINNHPNLPSFPSGHAAFFFALSMVIFLYNKKIYPPSKFWQGVGIGFFIASFLISLSRVICGIHWPSDILIGALVGIFSGWLIILFSQRFLSTSSKQLLQ